MRSKLTEQVQPTVLQPTHRAIGKDRSSRLDKSRLGFDADFKPAASRIVNKPPSPC